MRMVLLLLLTSSCLFAGQTHDAIGFRDNSLNALEIFNPNTSIPNFTSSPPEISLKSDKDDDNQVFQEEALKRLSTDNRASFVMKEAHQRVKITPNDKSAEILQGARLIEAAEGVVHPGCHKVPVPCEERVTEKTCEEKRGLKALTCTKHLKVHLNAFKHKKVSRTFSIPLLTIDLTKCSKQDAFCTSSQLIQLHPECEDLKVSVHVIGMNTEIKVVKAPTCQDPTLKVSGMYLQPFFQATVSVVEYHTEEGWEEGACEGFNEECMLESTDACLEPNQTKIIDGMSVTRPCWGEERRYQCIEPLDSNCGPLLENGCSNVRGECLSKIGDVCVLMSRVFQCTERQCFPDKEVCSTEEIYCANGSCDTSQSEGSDDLEEGVSRLGALAGAAEEVERTQARSRWPSIFKGESQECEKYILNLRDCCVDSGLLEDFMHCPREMQELQRAKSEHRAFYLGHYQHGIFGTTRYVYCVFPTKLSGIVQIQGRYEQLHIPFGDAEEPNCRGITPEELEHIDFKALDLHELVNELTSKTVIPDSKSIENFNISHAKILYDKGVPYEK